MPEETNKQSQAVGVQRASHSHDSYNPKTYLLAIAINEYEHISPLFNCVNDAWEVIQLLTREYEVEAENTRFICGGRNGRNWKDVEELKRILVPPSSEEEWESVEKEVLALKKTLNARKDTVSAESWAIFHKLQALIPEDSSRPDVSLAETKEKLLQQLDQLAASLGEEAGTLGIDLDLLKEKIELPRAMASREVIFREFRRLAADIQADISQTEEEGGKRHINLIIYYSGHGWYDKKMMKQGYWLPINAKKGDYSQFISFRTIRDFLEIIPTHHTVLFSDSCFSGSLFEQTTTRGESLDNEADNELELRPSRWGLTAGRSDEEVLDAIPEKAKKGDQGDDNSPFAGCLLDILEREEQINFQALVSKVRSEVKKKGLDQMPVGEPLGVAGHDSAGMFVFRKKNKARRFFEAGKLLMELATHRPEYERYHAASKQFRLARDKHKKLDDNYHLYALWEAKALCLAGDFQEAEKVLKRSLRRRKRSALIRELLFQAILINCLRVEKLSVKEFDQTRKYVHELRETMKENPVPAFVSMTNLIDTYLDSVMGKVYLLSIGINRYQSQSLSNLGSCVNDIKSLRSTLDKYIRKQDLRSSSLINEEATRMNILESLHEMRGKLSESDSFVFHFCGHSLDSESITKLGWEKEGTPFLVPVDADRPFEELITCEELHQALLAIPARQKTVILDVHESKPFFALAETGDYSLLFGAEDTLAWEHAGQGLFSGALNSVMDNPPASVADWKEEIIQEMKRIQPKSKREAGGNYEQGWGRQRPKLYREEEFFSSLLIPMIGKAIIPGLFGPQNPLSLQACKRTYELLLAQDISVSPDIWMRLAERLEKQGNWQASNDAYHRVLKAQENLAESSNSLLQTDIKTWKVYVGMAQTYLALGAVEDASQSLEACQALFRTEDIRRPVRHAVARLSKRLQQVINKSSYALLIGIDTYSGANKRAIGASKDVDEWKKMLAEMGYREENMTILKNEEAVSDKILQAFEQLCEQAIDHAVFFFFAGLGAVDEEGTHRALVPYDGLLSKEKETVLSFAELAQRSKRTKHLTVVLDAGFGNGALASGGRFLRYSPADQQAEPVDSFGNTCIIPGLYSEEKDRVELGWVNSRQGRLTPKMIEYLKRNPSATSTNMIHAIREAKHLV
ncbi:MAG: caspase family protein [Bacteroidota bacterium]